MAAPPLVPSPQQQAALDALRSRADTAGSFISTPQPGSSPAGEVVLTALLCMCKRVLGPQPCQ